MMRKYLVVPSLLLACLTGCEDLGEPLGECRDPEVEGRRPVVSNGRVMYAGQAIMLQACASCHSPGATGKARFGAPAGLDFDVSPVSATGTTTRPNAQGGVDVVATVDEEQLRRLRAQQRKVFDERVSIWDQVTKGLMPPSGVGEPFSRAKIGALTGSNGLCALGEELGPITSKATQEELREWLACGAPVVETNASELPKPVPGIVGDQFPSCVSEPVDPTFDNVYERVLSQCIACHGLTMMAPDLDLSTPEKAYASLLGADGNGTATTSCSSNGNPLVTPGEIESSYLVAKVGGKNSGPICDDPMPPVGGDGLPADQRELLEAWIAEGAPGPGEPVSSGDGGL